jgi:hypothetical protein
MHIEDLLGVWSLESCIAKSADGAEMLPFGESPRGMLIYTASRRMSAVLMRRGRPRFGSGDLRGGTPEEIGEAFHGFDAYAGTFELDAPSGTLVHHAEVARFPNWEDRAQTRFARLVDGKLYLDTPPLPVFGQDWVVSLVWRRASQD